MRLHAFFAVLLLSGCAQGETIFGWGGPVDGFEPEGDSGDREELPPPEGFAWSVDVDDGAAHRLLADDGAIVLAASTTRVTVARFDADGTRAWSSELPQIAGAAPVEIGRSRGGQIVVLGSPSDGRKDLAIVALSRAGAPQWTGELVAEWGVLQARGVAVHETGAIAVVAEELVDGRSVRTVVEFLDGGGRHVASEAFSQPRGPAGVAADSQGFAVVGDAGVTEYYPHNTWIRGYRPDGILADANLIGVGLTAVWTRERDTNEGHEAWIGGIVDDSLSCLLPAFGVAGADMKESPTGNPLAMTSGDAVLSIESDAVVVYPNVSDPRAYAPEVGTPTHVAAGPYRDDPVFVLSADESTGTHRLHRLGD